MTKTLLAGAALIALAGAATAQDPATSTAPAAAATAPTPPADSGTPADSAAAPSGAPATSTDASGATAAPDATATSPDAAAPAATAEPSADAAATTGAATTATDPAAAASTGTTPPMTTDASATGTAPAGAGASAAVQSEWAKYDKDNTGSLTPLEFGQWVMAANGQDMTAQVQSTRTSKRANLPAVKVLNATAGAFSKADANKDRAVSPEELTSFLQG